MALTANFYRELLATARHLKQQGLRPVREIARRKNVNENLAHHWLYRARKLETASSSPNEPARGTSKRGR